MVFRSKIDKWFYLVVSGFIIVVVGSILPIIDPPALLRILVAVAILLLAAGLPIWLLVSTYYIVSDDLLSIRSGPFSWSIRLDQITSVQPSRSMLSSPALSLDRLKIVYGQGKEILISPNNRDQFLEAIGQRRRQA